MPNKVIDIPEVDQLWVSTVDKDRARIIKLVSYDEVRDIFTCTVVQDKKEPLNEGKQIKISTITLRFQWKHMCCICQYCSNNATHPEPDYKTRKHMLFVRLSNRRLPRDRRFKSDIFAIRFRCTSCNHIEEAFSS